VDRLSWLLVTLGSCVATPGVVEVRCAPDTGAHALARGLAYSQGLGEAEPVPERSGKVEPSPEGSGEVELSPKGSGEAEPSPDRSGELGPTPEG
jgi:hypothetical protein